MKEIRDFIEKADKFLLFATDTLSVTLRKEQV
jgi:hypothetical protein